MAVAGGMAGGIAAVALGTGVDDRLETTGRGFGLENRLQPNPRTTGDRLAGGGFDGVRSAEFAVIDSADQSASINAHRNPLSIRRP